VTRLRDTVGLVVSPEVFFDLVFTLGGLIVGQLRPVTSSQLTHGSRLARRDHWRTGSPRRTATRRCSAELLIDCEEDSDAPSNGMPGHT
jgi:hypothetical protein